MTQKAKCTVWATIALFICFVFVSDIAGTQAKNNGTPDDETVSSHPSATSHELGKEPGEGKIEVEKSAPPVAHKKKFPWLVVAGVVVVAAVVLYFVVLNKKYSLNVTVGEGVQGTPAAGNTKFKKGETVTYNFTLSPGFKDLSVRLDGSPVSASGSVKMDRNHALEATSTKTAAINVTSTPPGAQIWMDGVKTEHLTPFTFYFDVAGSHTVLLRKEGFKDFQATVQVTVGVETPVAGNMPPGHRESFDVAASSLWKPQNAAQWRVANGNYVCNARVLATTYSLLNYSWQSASYTFGARFLRHAGRPGMGTLFLLLVTPDILPLATGYGVYVTSTGIYWIARMNQFPLDSNWGSAYMIAIGYGHPAVVRGFDRWNSVRIVKSGSTYSVYFNDTLIKTFIDAVFDPRYVAIDMIGVDVPSETWFDDVFVDVNSARAPAMAAEPVPTSLPLTTGKLYELN